MIITQAPLRVSFFGGGTDYPDHFLEHGGAVLGSAIDQYAFITASRFDSKMFDYAVRISYRKTEIVQNLEEISHTPFKEALRLCGLEKDAEVNYFADLPAKTGLGSSSSFSVALLQALNALTGNKLSGLDLAYAAIDFERRVLGERVGCQDQTFAAVGGFNVLEFVKEDDIRVTPLNLSDERQEELNQHILMVYTGITRRAEEVVQTQLKDVSSNRERYFRMRKQVDKAYNIITGTGAVTPFCELLHEAWEEKRSLHSVISNPEIDTIYAKARAGGAIGGKLLGAGAGGFLMLLAPPEKHAAIREILQDYIFLTPTLNAPASHIVFDGTGRRLVNLGPLARAM
ncbi:hypothetical protein [Kordiimonas marina]|uniref:GHMP family kinase ATP-binding protein n=1 Tax=Kordiimonas marina TaxID=2872312 RepID=UPI001FF5C0E3|nr:hypothetical protein [Kordiimonas marina]MCJ9429980.1 hypothetical protein [Kordiimonas marina]